MYLTMVYVVPTDKPPTEGPRAVNSEPVPVLVPVPVTHKRKCKCETHTYKDSDSHINTVTDTNTVGAPKKGCKGKAKAIHL